MLFFFCVLVEVCVCPGHGENDVRGWMTVLIFTKDNAAKRKNPQQLASVDPRTGDGCNVDGTHGTSYKKQAISCKVPKIRNGEEKISNIGWQVGRK